jgi:hypothetical protein
VNVGAFTGNPDGGFEVLAPLELLHRKEAHDLRVMLPDHIHRGLELFGGGRCPFTRQLLRQNDDESAKRAIVSLRQLRHRE